MLLALGAADFMAECGPNGLETVKYAARADCSFCILHLPKLQPANSCSRVSTSVKESVMLASTECSVEGIQGDCFPQVFRHLLSLKSYLSASIYGASFVSKLMFT